MLDILIFVIVPGIICFCGGAWAHDPEMFWDMLGIKD